MLRIKIIAAGKIRERYLQEGIVAYRRSLAAYAWVDIVEVADEPCPPRLSRAEEENVKVREGERLLGRVCADDFVILLDVEGREMDSPAFARMLKSVAERGKTGLVFIIGGSLGVAERVRRRADFRWSFSRLTFPHQLIRLALLEQLDRTLVGKPE
ncbi:phosphatidylethanolamine N-methyltransferase [Acididesulfobacillus acetoxydans]|uniref:Ribosomal RNA large subunit methyltransferase H n=1 Tax=Acididesulfobacillus acetoxydans TaxID=1561005 RepID=A0A8S0WVQ0_9FIRM|nr:23S rRNA (pseudouridine(1915)-N(3))-methyltransferase RlmH [Acididesulfobacillus acetoxydans]CAA7599771.1 phosphatidylethanolamine N-methyltransferase [Acididesulfobacillus acetoxydans]CEJ07337.1 Ribosomal RNA large subunit methyltransferase H [Acididesulfobacillus acetoxydans]